MPESPLNSEARQRVLDAADRLFARRGYTAVTIKDIAAAVGIRHASLYHHVPGGKEQLYIEVTERNLRQHHAGISEAIRKHQGDLRAQLNAVADWLLTQPPMDMVRMVYSDMPDINAAAAERLSFMAVNSLIEPVAEALEQARQNGVIAHKDVGLVAGGLVGMIESLHAVPQDSLVQTRQAMAASLIDVMLRGLAKES
jgi:AcrR family transcriptional regulator